MSTESNIQAHTQHHSRETGSALLFKAALKNGVEDVLSLLQK